MIVVGSLLRIVGKIASYMLFAVTIFSAYGGRFDPDYFTFPAVAVLLLPYLAIATFVVSAAWIVARRFITGALGVFSLVAAWAPVSNVVPVQFSAKPDPGKVSFTVLTYNIIHGWDQQQKLPDPMGQKGNPAFDYVINSGADIVCLQEVVKFEDWEIPNLTKEMKDTLYKVYPYRAGMSYSDTKVLSKYPLDFIPARVYISDKRFDDRRYTFYKVNVKGNELMLINMHMGSVGLSEDERNVVTEMKSVQGAKSSISEMKGTIREKLRRSFRRRKIDASILRETLSNFRGPLVICGDFNDVPESYAYRLLKGEDLHDAYAETGFGPLVTYNQHMFWFHLDQIFYRGPLKALSVKKGKIKASDHYPLLATFEFTGESTGE